MHSKKAFQISPIQPGSIIPSGALFVTKTPELTIFPYVL